MADPHKDKVVLLLPMEGASALATDNIVVNDRTGRTVTNARSTYGYLSNSSSPPWGRYAYVAKDSYLWVADSSAWNFGTGDFTVECWVRFLALPALGSQAVFAAQYTTTGNQRGWQFGIYTDSGTVYKMRFVRSIDGTYSAGLAHLVTWGVSVNTWYHVAVTRRSGYLQLWLDGAPLGSAVADSNTYFDSTAPLTIGAHDHGAAVNFLDGYIKDLRITKGVARYTGNFSVSQNTKLDDQYWNKTVLAIHGEGTGTTFTDVSNQNATITTVGNTIHSTGVAPPFGMSSIYFDGSGDYLSVANAAAACNPNGIITIEFWMYVASIPGSTQFILCIGGSVGSNYGHVVYINSNASISFAVAKDSTPTDPTSVNSGVASISAATWQHVAIVKQGLSCSFYINGALTNSGSYTEEAEPTVSGTTVYVGQYYDNTASYRFLGYLKDLRITKGVARYTQNFNPWKVQDQYYKDSVLLVSGEGSGTTFTDGSPNNKTITTNGNTTHSTAVNPPFGTSSIYFDGSGDYLSVASLLAGDDFTAECWVRVSTIGTLQVFFSQYGVAGNPGRFGVSVDTSGHPLAFVNGLTEGNLSLTHTGTMYAATWHHVAFVRRAGYFYLFLDGVLGVTPTFRTGAVENTAFDVGRLGDSTYYFTGYIKDLRITKGVAKYTSDFTPVKQLSQTKSNGIPVTFPDKTGIKTIVKPLQWNESEQVKVMI